MHPSPQLTIAALAAALLLSPVAALVCSGNQNIDIANGGATDYSCGSFGGPVRLVWKVTGNSGFFFNDEVRNFGCV